MLKTYKFCIYPTKEQEKNWLNILITPCEEFGQVWLDAISRGEPFEFMPVDRALAEPKMGLRAITG